MDKKALFVIFLSVLIRLLLFSTGLSQWLMDRSEFSTPISSWRRLTEGLTLIRLGVSPYDGDLYHEMPLTLSLWRFLTDKLGISNMKFFFIFLDVLIASILYYSCELFSKDILEDEEDSRKSYHKDSHSIMLQEEGLSENKLLCLSCYLLNPLSIASCLSMNTSILNNLATILSFHSALKRNRLTLSFFLSLATYLSFYPFILILPFSILLAHHDKKENRIFGNSIFFTSILQTILCFTSILSFLLYVSKDPDWSYLSSTFGFILSAPDHNPNIGLFWYFFVEHFEHFKLFFLCVFQIHAVLYAFPITIRLLHHPYFASFIILSFFSLFKSYPSYTDFILWISMVFQFKFIFSRTRNVFLSSLTFVFCSILGVVFQFLWLQSGSANANFYFAATLGTTASQIIFLFDIIYSHQKRQHELISGPDKIGKDGKSPIYLLE